MKEYIKKFESASNANDYAIVDIPFTSTIGGTLTNLTCNQESKKISVDEQGNISIVDNVIPNDEIWYTSSDSNIVRPWNINALPTIVSNTYSNGKGVIKFTTDVTNVGYQAFLGRTSLTSIMISNNVISIGGEAFYNCNNLSYVTIGNGVNNIGWYAFFGCTALRSPVYNAHVFAFMPPSYSGAYTIPDGIESIASIAFRNCTGLTSITIPNSVTSIGNDAFSGCSSLPVINNLRYADTYLVEAVNVGLLSCIIKDGTKWIGSVAFSGCADLTSITIPDSVTSIGDCAFQDCSSLTSVIIPDSVISIGYGAFQDCNSLTSVTIPNSVTSMEYDAFRCGFGSYCGSLETITVGENVFTYDGISKDFEITLSNDETIYLDMYFNEG